MTRLKTCDSPASTAASCSFHAVVVSNAEEHFGHITHSAKLQRLPVVTSSGAKQVQYAFLLLLGEHSKLANFALNERNLLFRCRLRNGS
jgi:hypothetical protein